ncbi:hypothetical protein [Burkholderia metallica]|uniref:hypothetical protein n=1 Tax=Burkholderia metallica TaxID=488729 RepID=UPI00157B5739|nr:hypothetical protein [Burkholderia metallica]
MPGHHTAQSIDRRAADAAKFAAARATIGSNDYAAHFISALTGFFALPIPNRIQSSGASHASTIR